MRHQTYGRPQTLTRAQTRPRTTVFLRVGIVWSVLRVCRVHRHVTTLPRCGALPCPPISSWADILFFAREKDWRAVAGMTSRLG